MQSEQALCEQVTSAQGLKEVVNQPVTKSGGDRSNRASKRQTPQCPCSGAKEGFSSIGWFSKN